MSDDKYRQHSSEAPTVASFQLCGAILDAFLKLIHNAGAVGASINFYGTPSSTLRES